MSSSSKTALVTGGSRGIGRAIVYTLAKEGWQVYFTYYSSEHDQVNTICSEIAAKGGICQAFLLDISDPEKVKNFFKDNIKNKVFLDVLVNNAGITKDNLLVRMKHEDWDRVIKVNLYGTFYCTQEAAKIMLKQRKGKIINISSLVGQSGNAGQANYSASKAGIIGLTKSSALELAPRGITVNAVTPGFIETEMTEGINTEIKTKYLEKIPIRRYGKPEDVAETVAWLASDRTNYVTGQIIGINGGLYL